MQDHNIFVCKIYSESIFLGLNLTLHTHIPVHTLHMKKKEFSLLRRWKYPNKCKLMAQALGSNLRKFNHGFCHVWNKMSLQSAKYSEDELVELVKQCTVSNLDLAITQTTEDNKAEDSTDTRIKIRNEDVKLFDPISLCSFRAVPSC